MEARLSPEPESCAWWDILHESMVDRDSSHAEKVSVFRTRLEKMLGEPYKTAYASRPTDSSTKDKASTKCSNLATTFFNLQPTEAKPSHTTSIKSPPSEDEWEMLYVEEMCDHSLYPREDSKQALYSKPLPGEFLRAMEATANEEPKARTGDAMLKAVGEVLLEDSDIYVPQKPFHGPLKVRNPDHTSKAEDDQSQGPKDADLVCEAGESERETPFISKSSRVQLGSSAGLNSTKEVSKRPQQLCGKLSMQPLFLEQSPQMILRLNSLDRQAWTEVTPRLKGLGGQKVVSQKEWTRQLMVVQKTLHAEKDGILAKWGGQAPLAQLYYENTEPAPGQPTPALEEREELGILDYMNWTLTSPKFVGKDGAPLGPEAEWDELSRLVQLKSSQLYTPKHKSVSVQVPEPVSKVDKPDLSVEKQECISVAPLLSLQDEGNLRIIQLRLEKLEAMRDHDFIEWMRTFGPQPSTGKISPLSLTSSECFDGAGVYICPLPGRKLVMQHANETPDYEIEYGTMYRTEPIDARNPHLEDPGDGYLTLTFGSAWDLEESKAEAYQRLRRLGEHGWSDRQRLVLIALISHAKYIKKRGLLLGIGANAVIQTKPKGGPNWLLWLTECKHANLSLQACEDIQTLAVCLKDKAQQQIDMIQGFDIKHNLEKQVIPHEFSEANINDFWNRARQLYETDRAVFYLELAHFGITKTGEEDFIGEIPQLFYPQLEKFDME
jgi:hypothetical protein